MAAKLAYFVMIVFIAGQLSMVFFDVPLMEMFAFCFGAAFGFYEGYKTRVKENETIS